MDEYYLRNEQAPEPEGGWRKLRSEEIETLVKNANASDNWDNLLVSEQFTPHLIKNCEFYGLVRIGRLEEVYLEHHDLRVPVGLTNSRIIACDIGDNAAIHHVRYLAHYSPPPVAPLKRPDAESHPIKIYTSADRETPPWNDAEYWRTHPRLHCES